MASGSQYSQGRGGGGGGRGGYNRGGGYANKNKPCPNPLFEQWLIEWREDAASKNNKMQYVYGKALSSLRKYPLVLQSGTECTLLEYFGPGLAKQIDARLAAEHPHLVNRDGPGDLAMLLDLEPKKSSKAATSQGAKKKAKTGKTTEKLSSSASSKHSASQSQDDDEDEQMPRKNKTKKKATYVPAYRSGAYAFLVTLFQKEETPNYRGFMLKTDLMREAQDHCDVSVSKPETVGTHYTAWNSMATLIKKELVLKQGNPGKYTLTVEGRELAAKLLNADMANRPLHQPGGNSDLISDDESDTELAQENFQRITFKPGEFEIVLCVDTGEMNVKARKEEVIGELKKNGVPLEVVKLNIGDFVWVCRKSQNLTTGNRNRLTMSKPHDMVLPYVVERKRSDDLAHSIRDGRFHEQKHRLEQTGLQPIYLIETYGAGDWGLADGALGQAIANTQITNDFMVQETASLKDTCAYLTHMTRILTKLYQHKTVSNCTKEEWAALKTSTTGTYLMAFNDFNEFSTKTRNWTSSEMFARHLMKIWGLSVERAFAIIKRYPTLTDLFRGYKETSSTRDKESMLANIYYGNAGRTIGQNLSSAIYMFYSSKHFPA